MGTGLHHDSSLAAAAVHAGALRAGEWGVVDVTVLPGQSSYKEALRTGSPVGLMDPIQLVTSTRNTSKGMHVLPDPTG